MSRLIDADALLYEMVGITDGWLKPPKGWKWYEDSVRNAPTIEAEAVVRCKDCKHFCIKDHFGNFNGVPILGASDVPTCDAWANTECMVRPDGYCFLAEKKTGRE